MTSLMVFRNLDEWFPAKVTVKHPLLNDEIPYEIRFEQGALSAYLVRENKG
jgi:hypothetical protein